MSYKQLLVDIQTLLEKGKNKAYQAVDNIRVQTYWQIGERIVREELQNKIRAEYGKKIIDYLAKDLNFSRSLLFEIVEFYKTYPIIHTLCGQLSWSHYRLLLKMKSPESRQYYQDQILNNLWSKRELEKHIKNNEFNPIKIKTKGIIAQNKSISPDVVFKDTYHWDFLQLTKNHSEKDLEKALINNIRQTLMEFGYGFCFMGEQIKILIAGQYHKIDLLFYHRDLQCLIIVELKTEKFNDSHIGQMNKYLTYFQEQQKRPWEKDPVGLIICKEKNNEEVHYALGKLKKDIFVAEYKLYLPTENEIKNKISKKIIH
jgi:predicted nuclease of restriction endonuclease-like (RecB) superfamily